jgi:hypothetical protein
MLLCWPHVVAANLPFTGPDARCSAYQLNPAFHLFSTVAGRGAAGPSSNYKSSSTSTGIPSGITGLYSRSQDCQPCDEKKLGLGAQALLILAAGVPLLDPNQLSEVRDRMQLLQPEMLPGVTPAKVPDCKALCV